MKLIKFFTFSLLGLFLVALPVLAQDFPQSTGYVNDFGQLLSTSFRQELETDLQNFEKETTVEIAVVTIESLGDTYLEDYAVRLFEDWEIGKKEKDNGLLILVAKEDRKIRIEVGYGLEPIITDGRTGKVIREQMTPAFKKGDYDQGIELAVGEIKGYIRSGEPPQEEVVEIAEETSSFISFLIIIFFIFVYFSSFFARTKSFWAGGVLGGILGLISGVIIGSFIASILSAIGLGSLGLIFDYILSKNYKNLKKGKKKTGFFSSWGGFSGGGGRGGGFGGFGGGSSGGGGASGGW